MIKYASYAVTFAEVPDEVCLTIQVTNCPCRCDGCHSAYLQQDTGEDLEADLPLLLEQYAGRITCVCFMGTGSDLDALARCVKLINRSGLKTALYSGYPDDKMWTWIQDIYIKNGASGIPRYLKTGPYIQTLGGLDSRTTNQRMYALSHGRYQDITQRFWKKRIEDMI